MNDAKVKNAIVLFLNEKNKIEQFRDWQEKVPIYSVDDIIQSVKKSSGNTTVYMTKQKQ